MASDPLIDLSTIDLDRVAITADEVGRMNPQVGGMRQLDHVIWVSDDAHLVLGVKHVREDEFWVPLHIPGRPIMPGVLMIEAAAQIGSIQYRHGRDDNRFLGFTRCDETIFRRQVLPGETLYLASKQLKASQRRFVTRAQGVVDGTVIFESKITGMPM